MKRDDYIVRRQFKEVPFGDSFFDSLRNSYREFDDWAARKSDEGEYAYIVKDENDSVQAFMYLKEEFGGVDDVVPHIKTDHALKVGTFKVNPHGTKLEERFVKKIIDEALVKGVGHIYLTIFPQYEPLISILKRYGFVDHGEKITGNGVEKVFLKDFANISNDILLDYPIIISKGHKKWLLSIYPKWHTKLFPDSILNTEQASIVEDLSHTNSIHKVYIAWMKGMDNIEKGDCLVMYRTRETGKSAQYSSVATSLCVVEDVRSGNSFDNVEDFMGYCIGYSVFSEGELREFYSKRKSSLYVVKMTYNIALPKRPNRQMLIDQCGLDRNGYWGLMEIAPNMFKEIIRVGKIYEGVVVY